MAGVVTVEYLREVLRYDPSNGAFFWRAKIARKIVVGSRAGGIDVSGYRVIGIGGSNYYAHRLAWLFMTGNMPDQIDHKNGNRDDNRWSNLRLATSQQNLMNSKLAKNNTSGRKGVSWHKGAGKWSAYIINNGKKYHLGLFDDLSDASAAYINAANKIQPEFARAS